MRIPFVGRIGSSELNSPTHWRKLAPASLSTSFAGSKRGPANHPIGEGEQRFSAPRAKTAEAYSVERTTRNTLGV
jgi:hypothetical protein